MNYTINSPYPTPRVEKENKEYGYLLLDDYAGGISEESAIHTYLYQSLRNLEFKELKEILLTISKVEMHHLLLLGEVIKLLGVDPRFESFTTEKTPRYWTASYISYEKDLKKLLEQDIQAEKDAIEKYRLHQKEIKDIYIKELLERIIQDELLHVQIFTTLYNQIQAV